MSFTETGITRSSRKSNKWNSYLVTDPKDLILARLFYKDFFCCPHSYLSPDTPVLYFDLIQTIR